MNPTHEEIIAWMQETSKTCDIYVFTNADGWFCLCVQDAENDFSGATLEEAITAAMKESAK